MVTQFTEKSAPRVEPFECFALKAVLLGVMAERAVGDFEELGGPRANTTSFLEGSSRVWVFHRSAEALEEVPCQERSIFTTLAQSGNLDGDHAEAVITLRR